ncbi:MAG: polyribonucleotide nucleotidyltransferase [Armatimonadota bacterium]
MLDKQVVTTQFAGRELRLETGELARQASAAVLARYGDTVVLCTVVIDDKPNPAATFLPLRVDFEEKMYAVGRIPGGFFKREGRPSTEATLVSRNVDRPIRPLLPQGLRNEVQVICTALSAENQNSAELVAMIGASAAMHLSPAPFAGPFAAAQVAWLEGEMVLNPSFEQRERARMDLTVAAGHMGVMQVELGGDEVPEEIVLEGIRMAASACLPVCDAIEELRRIASKPKREYPIWEPSEQVRAAVAARADAIREAIQSPDKAGRQRHLDAITEELLTQFADLEDAAAQIDEAMYEMQKTQMRRIILDEHRRVDGRAADQIRPLDIQVGLLPRTHGSALFTRGETQVLSTVTLGATRDQRMVRTLEEEEYERFMHHYNFPPFCTGEAKPLRGASRREIGHGALVERSLERMLPSDEDWPYTTRVVSDVLESNGSSSMASTCASSLALMDGGVPIKTAVAGISVGLLFESEEKYVLLTDIQGLEDASGDMDFKVTGTERGVNGLHLDIKLHGLPEHVLAEGLAQAKRARLQILEAMNAVLSAPRETLSPYAPRMIAMQVPVDKIGLVIGPGGKTIRKFEDDLEVKIDIEDDGVVKIFGEDPEKVEAARSAIYDLTREVEVGEVFTGKVVTITDFGAFIEILPGRDGLLHISDIEHTRTNRVEDVLKLGDEVTVKVIEVEPTGKVRLSRKALIEGTGTEGERRGESSGRSSRGGRDRRRGGGGGGANRAGARQSSRDAGDDGEPTSGAYFRDKKR